MLKKMRQCRLNFAENRYDCEAGIIGEHYATELIVTPPAIMPSEAVYRLCFEPGGLSEIILQTTDGTLPYPLPSAVTATPYCCVTLIGYVGSEQIYKSRMVRLHFSQTADGDSSIIDPRQPGIVDEVNQNTAARHGHDNKAVLDKFAESDGKPTYGGQALGGGGASTAEGVSYTNTQLPNVANVKTALDALVPKSHNHANKDTLDLLSAADGKLKYNGSDVGLKGDKGADGITPTIGTNGNWYLGTTDTGKPSRGEKGDKGADGTNGKDGINGKTPVKGTDYWTEADKAEIVTDTLAALPKWTGGNY